jgi:DNA-binding LacI/PurR family transcriptional regulator
VGCDDIEIGAFVDPPLTTIHIPRDEIARCAFTALFAVSQRGELGRNHKIAVTLVLRQSTAVAHQQSHGRVREIS